MAAELDLDPLVALQADFRAAMGHVAAAVSVVTRYADGRPYGATVSAFLSLSMEPPMMLVSLHRKSSLLGRVDFGAPLGVNVLSAEQHGLAEAFARRAHDRFAHVTWALCDGAPALLGAHAYVALTVERMIPAGDHVVVIGQVTSATTETGPGPLTYHRRGYGTHHPR